jgi:hypothetical protein
LIAIDSISARIKELQVVVSERVIASEVRRRSWRVQLLQTRIDKALAASEARAVMYADELSETSQFQVNDREAELIAIAEGCRVLPIYVPAPEPKPADWKDIAPPAPPAPPPEYPKTMVHPGYPTGGATGVLMKDYRGKDANQVIWKFDSALEARIADNLKQAAIEEGQWTEKREVSGRVGVEVAKVELRREQRRIADEKKAALAAGLPWPPTK